MRVLLLLFLTCVFVRPVKSQVCNIHGNFPGISQVIISYKGSSFLNMATDTLSINSDGTFSYQVSLERGPRHCYLKFSDRELVVWAAESKDIFIEFEKNSQPIFLGETKDIQYYLLNKDDQWNKIYNHFKKNDLFNYLSKPHTDEYFDFQDQITAGRIAYLKGSISTTNNDSTVLNDFINRETLDLIFLNLFYKLNYEDAQIEKFEFTAQKNDIQRHRYYGYTEKNPFNAPELTSSQQFLNFANMFFIQLAIKSLKRQTHTGERERYIRQVFAAIDSTISNEYCRQMHKIHFLADDLKDLTYHGSPADLTPELFNKYLDSIKNYPSTDKEVSALKVLFDKKHDEIKNLTGLSVDGCILRDQSGNQFDFTSLRGKLIYIDVWASWCRPCIQSIPAWNAMVKTWEADEEVTFLMISIDASIEKWKNALSKYQPDALQLISPGDFEKSDFARKLKIHSLPAYVLIDENGKVITSNAPPVGSIQLSTFLESYFPR